ncbi:hypothetical protein [Microbacterium sp. SORGH_AS_0888]|uniref:hypothetical protein n=1 Tax=Microbacterium sp. SORGH_AS_0888 TaxID=3041791 RepID=UPI00278600A7|nr:hypothetical protein [Microbacterium sp. SORGH_AS_0888]MDQ1129378.1 hypothetical protein [Microbacterium sp. SORGH_AS_0888]
MSEQPPSRSVRPSVVLGMCTVGFFAVVVAGLGFASLLTDADVIAVRGLGQGPGVVGIAIACATFAIAVWSAIRRPPGSFRSVPVVVAATYLAYVLATGVAAAVVSSDLGAGLAVTGELATGWQGGVVAAAALLAGIAGVALARMSAARPRWPWERDDED